MTLMTYEDYKQKEGTFQKIDKIIIKEIWQDFAKKKREKN